MVEKAQSQGVGQECPKTIDIAIVYSISIQNHDGDFDYDDEE